MNRCPRELNLKREKTLAHRKIISETPTVPTLLRTDRDLTNPAKVRFFFSLVACFDHVNS